MERKAWSVVAGALALAGAATLLLVPRGGSSRETGSRPPPRERAPTRDDAPPEPVSARRVEREPALGYDPRGKGRATITVVDAATGAPLPQAWVAYPWQREPFLDEGPDGRDLPEKEFDPAAEFEIRGHEKNPVVLEPWWTGLFVVAGCDGYLPGTAEAMVTPDTPDVALTIALRRGGAIEVVARSAVDGAPVEGVAMVALLEACDAQLASLFRDMEARVRIVGAETRPRVPVFPSPPPSDLAAANQLEPPLTLADAMARLKERPGENWSAEFFRGGPTKWFLASRGGSATFGPLAPDDGWAVMFWPSGPFQHRVARSVAVADGATTRVELVVAPANLVEGRVQFDDGAPAPDAVLYVATETADDETDVGVLRLLVDREGRFAIPVDRARMLVVASLDRERDGHLGVGYGDFAYVDFGADAGGTRKFELVFSREPRDATGRLQVVRGRVVTPDGAPAAGAYVHAGVYGPITHCDSDGRFELRGGFGALYHSMAPYDRDERWPTEEFQLSALWEPTQAGRRGRQLVGHALFAPAAPDAESELLVRLGR